MNMANVNFVFFCGDWMVLLRSRRAAKNANRPARITMNASLDKKSDSKRWLKKVTKNYGAYFDILRITPANISTHRASNPTAWNGISATIWVVWEARLTSSASATKQVG